MAIALGNYLLPRLANLELECHTTHTAAIFTIKMKWANKRKIFRTNQKLEQPMDLIL